MEIVDIIIVGSGCAASSVASEVCGKGKKILMLDVGIDLDTSKSLKQNFIEYKHADTQTQSDFFLGKNYESLEDNKPNLPQKTPFRSHISSFVDTFAPLKSDSFFPMESLALGGLGIGWGLGSYVFSQVELQKKGLPIDLMKEAYKHEVKRIGISAEKEDDASLYCHGGYTPIQKPLKINAISQKLLQRYTQKKKSFHQKRLFLGKSSLALLSENLGERKAYNYNDTEFYDNQGDSAYRPDYVIRNLTSKGALNYIKDCLVLSFEETLDTVFVHCLDTKKHEKTTFVGRKLIIAAGCLATSRIVLRSFKKEQKLPILCNAYSYIPMTYLPFIGKQNTGKQFSLAQLNLFYDKNGDHSQVVMASIYNYRSLLNFRLLEQIPLGYKSSMALMKHLLPSFCIAGVFHPAEYNSSNEVELVKSENTLTNDILKVHYVYSSSEKGVFEKDESLIKNMFRKLYCIPLKTVKTLNGASIHYAGTLPFKENEELFHLSPEGVLYGTKNVYVADASGFKFLSGKGLTLTIMAYAHLVAKKCLQDL